MPQLPKLPFPAWNRHKHKHNKYASPVLTARQTTQLQTKFGKMKPNEERFLTSLFENFKCETEQDIVTMVHLLKGAHIEFEDDGRLYEQWKSKIESLRSRTNSSSHKSDMPQWSLQGELLVESLFGRRTEYDLHIVESLPSNPKPGILYLLTNGKYTTYNPKWDEKPHQGNLYLDFFETRVLNSNDKTKLMHQLNSVNIPKLKTLALKIIKSKGHAPQTAYSLHIVDSLPLYPELGNLYLLKNGEYTIFNERDPNKPHRGNLYTEFDALTALNRQEKDELINQLDKLYYGNLKALALKITTPRGHTLAQYAKTKTWIQLESHSTSLYQIIGHLLTYIRHKWHGLNIGPLGDSHYTEVAPLRLELPDDSSAAAKQQRVDKWVSFFLGAPNSQSVLDEAAESGLINRSRTRNWV